MDQLDSLSDLLGPSIASNSENATYIAELTSLPLDSLRSEPANLNSTSAQLTNALTTLCHTSYPTFLSLHSASTSLSTTLSSLSSSLTSLLTTLPSLQDSTRSFGERTTPLIAERRQAILVREHTSKLADILELPRLFETCVRNGSFADALDLAVHATTLARKFPDIPLVQDVKAEMDVAERAMLAQLLESLSEPGKGRLPALFKAVGFLRRMQVFEEDELALAFLTSRIAALNAGLDAVEMEKGVDADRDKEYYARYMKKYIDVWREGVYDVVTQYTTIFLDRAIATSTASPVSPSPRSLLPVTSSPELAQTLHALLTTFTNSLLTRMLALLRAHVLPIRERDPAALSALLTQLTYCASSFARVGMDFRALVAPIFVDAVREGVTRELRDAERIFSDKFQDTKTKISLVAPSLASHPPDADTDSVLKSPPHVVPQVLASYPPFAEFANVLLTSFNGLRLLAPKELLEDLLAVLDDVLSQAGAAMLEWVKAQREGDNDTGIDKAAGRVYVRVFVPYMRRALVEGVYGLDRRESTEDKLNRVLDDWESWIGGHGPMVYQ